jgi:alpha-ketoglutarate-dependent taurine dioxygenase
MTVQLTTSPATEPRELEIVPVAGRIGGEVRGVRLSGELPPAEIDRLRKALCRHKVLFFRDQNHLDDAGHQAFGRRWGVPTVHPTAPDQVGDFLLELDSQHGGKANAWHTDLTFMASYPEASILRAVTIPSFGGDTVWANTVEAYNRLPETLRDLADRLWAVHSNDYDYAANQTDPDPETDAYHQQFISTVFEAEHPLVRVHPETGERTLVLGSFFKQFVGLSVPDSQRLYETFQSHITRLENTVRWRWREGDVAIWDNRATQHYAIADYGEERRVVRRVTVNTDVALGLDGRRSRQLKPASTPNLQVA